jgi:CheY-like chemotaxis protein
VSHKPPQSQSYLVENARAVRLKATWFRRLSGLETVLSEFHPKYDFSRENVHQVDFVAGSVCESPQGIPANSSVVNDTQEFCLPRRSFLADEVPTLHSTNLYRWRKGFNRGYMGGKTYRISRITPRAFDVCILSSIVPRILIVDDNPRIRRIVRERLESEGLEVHEAADGIEAIEKAPDLNPDLVILDVTMPRLNGIDAARILRKRSPKLPIILHTLHAAVIVSQGLPEGVSVVVLKGEPLTPHVRRLLRHRT